MLLDVCLGTKSAWRILFVLAEAPGKAVTRKEIQDLTKLGNKVLTKFLLLLTAFNIILANKIGKTYNYKLNLANPFTESILNIIRLEESKLNKPDFRTMTILREFVYELTNVDLENLKDIILFGSYAKRTFHEGSDIDVAIILKEKDVNDELVITDIVDKLDKRFRAKMQPHYYSEKEFDDLKKKKNKLVDEIIKDGIKLL
ncbi:MAG: nucleotidyltransferase domain-containing protein [Nanoarchaeota archaeon]|nr:nucleotidyltransferase domain-containing protein [Nanoarchaeota archaeon]MCG2718154.1 nucleotidyltransferase domain-containing protein [Nanoarchaeota archaeon]